MAMARIYWDVTHYAMVRASMYMRARTHTHTHTHGIYICIDVYVYMYLVGSHTHTHTHTHTHSPREHTLTYILKTTCTQKTNRLKRSSGRALSSA